MTKDFVMKTFERWINAKYNYFNLEVVSMKNKKAEIIIRFEEKKEAHD